VFDYCSKYVWTAYRWWDQGPQFFRGDGAAALHWIPLSIWPAFSWNMSKVSLFLKENQKNCWALSSAIRSPYVRRLRLQTSSSPSMTKHCARLPLLMNICWYCFHASDLEFKSGPPLLKWFRHPLQRCTSTLVFSLRL